MYKIKSTFIETPCRKLLRLHDDFTVIDNEERGGRSYKQLLGTDLSGVHIRYDVTVYQDEAGLIDKEATEKTYLDQGAASVDIRLIRIPRQTVRSEAVLKVETLRDKLVAMAALKDETVPESILQKADDLEAGEIATEEAA